MKSGIIGTADGYDIFVDGQRRTFRDVETVAQQAASFLKVASKYKDRVELVSRSTGERVEVVT